MLQKWSGRRVCTLGYGKQVFALMRACLQEKILRQLCSEKVEMYSHCCGRPQLTESVTASEIISMVQVSDCKPFVLFVCLWD